MSYLLIGDLAANIFATTILTQQKLARGVLHQSSFTDSWE